MKGYIYVLKNEKEILYIGSTISSIGCRLINHKSAIKTSNSPLYRYLRRNKIELSISIIEEIVFKDKSRLINRESYWINYYSEQGVKLLNSVNNPRKLEINYCQVKSSKSIRVSDADYEIINSHCKKNNFVMGAWVGSVCCNNISTKQSK